MSIKEVSCQHDLHCFRLANVSGKTLGASGSGDGANVDLGLTEFRLFAGIDDIAQHCQLTTTPKLHGIKNIDFK